MKTVSALMNLMLVAIATVVLVGFLTATADISAQTGYPPPEPPAASTPLASGPNRLFLPLVAVRRRPATQDTESYYVVNFNTLFNTGRALGEKDRDTPGMQDRLVILHYGYPANNSPTNFGVKLTPSPTVFVWMDSVINSTLAFAQGWYSGTGTDTQSHLRIVLGVVNCCQSSNIYDDLALMQGHGAAWANAINTIRAQLTGALANQVDVVAGYDMEYEWNRPYASTQWVTKFAENSPAPCNTNSTYYDQGCLYNYGAINIPISGTNCATSVDLTIAQWQACDIWFASWGVKKPGTNTRIARALPQIYKRYDPSRPQYPWGIHATQWKDMSVFSIEQMGAGRMDFVGSLTQRGSCGDGCALGNNVPVEGYDLLTDALASDSRTSLFMIRWMTDIRYQP